MKNVVENITNKEVMINEESKNLYSYDNLKKVIIYNAPEVDENGEETGHYVEYTEKGIVSNIEERLQMWNNMIKLFYAVQVGFDAKNNDPNRAIWNGIVEKVKENENRFFTKKGNFRKRNIINVEKIFK